MFTFLIHCATRFECQHCGHCVAEVDRVTTCICADVTYSISTKRVMVTFQKATTEALPAAKMELCAMWEKRSKDTTGRSLQETSALGYVPLNAPLKKYQDLFSVQNSAHANELTSMCYQLLTRRRRSFLFLLCHNSSRR